MNRVIPTSAAATKRKESQQMKTWNEVTHFAGYDWPNDHHDVLVYDGPAYGWTLCQGKLAEFPRWPSRLKPGIALLLNGWSG